MLPACRLSIVEVAQLSGPGLNACYNAPYLKLKIDQWVNFHRVRHIVLQYLDILRVVMVLMVWGMEK